MTDNKQVSSLDDSTQDFEKFKDWWNSLQPKYETPEIIFKHFETYFKPQWQSQQTNEIPIERIESNSGAKPEGVVYEKGRIVKEIIQQTKPGLRWVNASDKLPSKSGKENSVTIRNNSPFNYFVTTGFKNYDTENPAIYFELGSKSYLTVYGPGNGNSTFDIKYIEWLDENN